MEKSSIILNIFKWVKIASASSNYSFFYQK